MFFKPQNGYSGNVSITVDGQSATYIVTSQTSATEAGWYQVDVKGIDPKALATPHTIKATTDHGEATITLSALSYARAVVERGLFSESGGPMAMAALYAYYAAAKAF